MPASTPSSAGAAGNILLVEEYDALAIAIGSALKKFAPAHQTRVVRTLAAAEAAALEHRPELLIVDFDPPQKGAAAFFNRLKASLPETRVLMIAAGTSHEVLSARRPPNAFRFVEKPFDLAEFGTAVRSLLELPATGSGQQPNGTLRDLGLMDLLPLHCAAGATIVLKAEAAGGRSGEFHLASGQIVHAVAAGRVGAAAVEEMLRWDAPQLTEAERPSERARTIQQPWPALLIDALQKTKPAAVTPVEPAQRAAAPPVAPPTKKLVVIDDTELLLVFVAEVLATAEPTWQVVTAGLGLDGVKQVESVIPDAVLLDFSLPDITGDEVCRRLLENPKTANIPIIMMSGHVPEMTHTAAQHDNVVATIAKPFLSHAMVALAQKILTAPPARRRKKAPATAQTPNPPPIAPQAAAISQPPAPAVEGGNKHDVASPQNASSISASPPQPPAAAPPAGKFPNQRIASPEVPVSLPAVLAPIAPLRVLPKEAPPTAPVPAAPQPRSQSPAGEKTVRFEIPAEQPVARVRISAATDNAVVLGLSLEVLAMRFSSALRMAAIRARPSSWTVSLHVHPHALPGVRLPEAGFELGKVELNARGHIDAVRLVPTAGRLVRPLDQGVFPVSDVTILPGSDERAMELLPAAAAPMTMQLFASFELVDVELSPTFGIGALVLKSRGGDIRVTLQPANASTGATFKTAQVLLDRSARIAEILLDAVA